MPIAIRRPIALECAIDGIDVFTYTEVIFMKSIRWYYFVGLIALIGAIWLVACGPSSTPIPISTLTPTPSPTADGIVKQVPTLLPTPEPTEVRPTPTTQPESTKQLRDITIRILPYEQFTPLLNAGKVQNIKLNFSHTFPVGFSGLEMVKAEVSLKGGGGFDVYGPAESLLVEIEQEIGRCGEPCKDVKVEVIEGK